MELNLLVFNFLNQFGNISVAINTLVIFSAVHLGNILIILSVIFILFHRDGKIIHSAKMRSQFKQKLREGVLLFASAIFAWSISKIMKNIFDAPRPFIKLEDINNLFVYGGYDSFPSGHAVFFSALAVSLLLYHRPIGIMFAIGALIIGIARIIAGIHYPIDILAGYLIGGTIAYILFRLLNLKRVK